MSNIMLAIADATENSKNLHETNNKLKHDKTLIEAQIGLNKAKLVALDHKVHQLQISLQHKVIAAEDNNEIIKAANNLLQFIETADMEKKCANEDGHRFDIWQATEFKSVIEQLKDVIDTTITHPLQL